MTGEGQPSPHAMDDLNLIVSNPQALARLMTLRLRAISRFCSLVTADDTEADKLATWQQVTGEVLLSEQMRQVASGSDLDEEAFAQVMASVDLAQVLADAADPMKRQQIDPQRALHERRPRNS